MDPITTDQGATDEQIIESAEEVQQPEPTPSSDQTPIEDEEALALENSKNPERTASYIAKLKEQVAQAEVKAKATVAPQEPETPIPSIYDSFYPQKETPSYVDPALTQNLSQDQINTTVDKFVDENGNVDIAGLNRALAQSQQLAQQAVAEARQARADYVRFEQTQQTQRAYQEHPEMNPLNKDTFDPELYNLVRDRVMRENVWEGKNKPLTNIIAEVKRTYQRPNTKELEQKAVEQYKQTQQARVQGPLSQGRAGSEKPDMSELRERTRRGDSKAISERLKALGI